MRTDGPAWLIVADDLTGAADCAIAFARAELSTVVTWNQAGASEALQASVVSLDLGTRGLPVEEACRRHEEAMEQQFRPGQSVFKKVDSIWRGRPAEEIAATLSALRRAGGPKVAVLAPAFPAAGRTTVDGKVVVKGLPLEQSSVFGPEHRYPDGDLMRALAGAGLRAAGLSLVALRGDAAAAVRAAVPAADVLVADAETTDDLAALIDGIEAAKLACCWVGTAGLAHALAARATAGGAEDKAGLPVPTQPQGGILIVVGSLAAAARDGAALLRGRDAARAVTVPPADLLAGTVDAAPIAAALSAGHDMLVEIEAGPGADPSTGAELAHRLARALVPALAQAGGLIATGGETAAALLHAAGLDRLHMRQEVEPGVPLALATGPFTLPIVTKAGAFGDELTLSRALEALHALRFQGS